MAKQFLTYLQLRGIHTVEFIRPSISRMADLVEWEDRRAFVSPVYFVSPSQTHNTPPKIIIGSPDFTPVPEETRAYQVTAAESISSRQKKSYRMQG